MLATIVPNGDRQALLVLLFYARALSSFQGALILAESEMTVEARTLARSCLESSFYLGAVNNDTDFVDQLINSDTAHKKKVAKWLTSPEAAVTELSEDQIEKVAEFLDHLKSSGAATESIIMRQAAQKARLGDIYETVYRDLSNGAAHPSLNSLSRHVEQDSGGNVVGLRFGPDARDISETILAMTTALFYAISVVASRFPHEVCGSEIDACWEIHKGLIGEQESSISP
jgi:hypothetical protein